eukprot:GHVT01088784.1.p1 GENE.GHVT01088784.1~~GHVT01088784.1.p1  ORF type:complete len:306 (-),score=82.07 GHVT01088784.1:493-1410(-)
MQRGVGVRPSIGSSPAGRAAAPSGARSRVFLAAEAQVARHSTVANRPSPPSPRVSPAPAVRPPATCFVGAAQPVDLSFQGLWTIQEITVELLQAALREACGRLGDSRQLGASPSAPALQSAAAAVHPVGRLSPPPWTNAQPRARPKQHTQETPLAVRGIGHLRLSNNKLCATDDLCARVDLLLPPCNLAASLQWLDLSFNLIERLQPTAFEPLQNLATLYIHANKLHALDNVADGLKALPKLHTLTLMGNPLQENLQNNYRRRVVAALPNIRRLDHTAVTSSEIPRGHAAATSPSSKSRQLALPS